MHIFERSAKTNEIKNLNKGDVQVENIKCYFIGISHYRCN